MTEVIKDIKGFEGRYTISNLGIVRSLLTGKVMKPYITKFGYARVNLRIAHSRDYKSYLVHRLVASAFLENKNNLIISANSCLYLTINCYICSNYNDI